MTEFRMSKTSNKVIITILRYVSSFYNGFIDLVTKYISFVILKFGITELQNNQIEYFSTYTYQNKNILVFKRRFCHIHISSSKLSSGSQSKYILC